MFYNPPPLWRVSGAGYLVNIRATSAAQAVMRLATRTNVEGLYTVNGKQMECAKDKIGRYINTDNQKKSNGEHR